MAIKIKGSLGSSYAIQPGFSLTEKNDGTIEGQVVFICDSSGLSNLPQMGSAHPTDYRCELYNREITYLTLDRIQMTGSYFGLVANTTEAIISYTPNTNQEPITSHPQFESFAGTSENPSNGATFDEDTGEFLGFFDPAIKNLFGVMYYLTPATLLSRTYWTKTVPLLNKRMKRITTIPGFRKPSDCKEFLILDYPYRQIGNFYQVTEQIMGSGPNGFSTILYP
jgi:hypothetical protein